MKIKGTRVVYRPVGDTSGICCSNAIKRKKQFEYRRNCSKRKDGIKLSMLKDTEANIINIIYQVITAEEVPIFGCRNVIVAVSLRLWQPEEYNPLVTLLQRHARRGDVVII